MKRSVLFRIVIAMLFTVIIAATASAEAWKFGVMSDTQWTCPDDPAGVNLNNVSVSIINQLNQKFIEAGVKFVIQVGDLTENGNDADIATRAAASQALYDHGIGFFPMRGNHETYANPANQYGIPAVQSNFPQTRGSGPNRFGAKNFSSPTLPDPYPDDLDGMSYSFDYGDKGNKARFLIIDNWVTPNKLVAPGNGYNYGYSIAEQQDWISDRLNIHTRRTEHAFVFSHQNLMGQNHQDSPFQGYTDANPDMQNVFYASLADNGVMYYISGHDHIHQRSIVKSPDGQSSVEELIGASNSSKFYTPKALADPKWYGQKVRETSISQEMYTVGYYIFTVDGPRVTVDYYSDDHGTWLSDKSYPSGPPDAGTHTTPTFNFVKKETWGYSLNGQEFLVPQGTPYTVVQDGFKSTSAKILNGTNTSTAQDYTLRPLTKDVNTGWTPKTAWTRNRDDDPVSDILTLWGMADLGSKMTDVYTLSMSYDDRLLPIELGKGLLGLATKNENGDWVNAVDMNLDGGTKKFILGPWKPGYGLGTYGIDLRKRTAWAVINYNGDFAIAGFRHFDGHR